MQNHLVKELERVDRYNDPVRFYSLLWERIVLFKPDEAKMILDWSSEIKELKKINAGHHAFAEGIMAIHSSDFPKVISHLLIAAEIFDSLDNSGGSMASRTMMCTCYRSLGQLDKAQDSVQQALQFESKVKDDDIYRFFKGVTFYQAAEVNVEFNNYETAVEFYNSGIKLTDEHPELKGRFLNGLGVLLMNQENWDDAISYLNQSLEIISGQNNLLLESKILSDIGIFYFKNKNFEKSFFYQEHSLKMRLEKNMFSPAVTNYIRLAELCLASEKTEEALRYGILAKEHAEKLKLNIKVYEAHHVLSNIYELLGDSETSYKHYKLYHKYKEEVHSQEVIKKVEQIKNQYKIESAQQEKEIFRLRNVELKAAMDEITESFRYAKRIQNAILPPDSLIKSILPDSFVLFMPKDIVSGDFYWLEIVGNKILIAAVDCTGHGVPGAMVSMVGHNCLNKAVHEFGLSQPAMILNKLTELVEGTFVHKDFQYENIGDEIKDGMDISLCCIDLQEKKLEWAGANNPLWMIRNGELVEVTADKQPVGKFEHRHPFTNHQMDLQMGDKFYLFTDGYADQFGGANGKKFKYKQLKELVLSLKNNNMQEQKEVLQNRLVEWRGGLEQVDDILIIGFGIV